MTMKLYYSPGACSFVPHTLLELAGADFEPVMVKLHKGEQNGDVYRAINRRGQVPVLVDGEQVITQIVAIVGYLNDRFPGQHYLPADPLARARVMELLAWLNNTVHPTFTHVFMPHKFVDDPRKVVNPGDQVTIRVLGVDLEKNQISLSMKLEAAPERQAKMNESRERREERGPRGPRPGGPGGGGRDRNQ